MSGFQQGNGYDQNLGFDQGNGYDQNGGGYDQNGGGFDPNNPPHGNGSMENLPSAGAAQPVTSEAARTLWMGDLDAWMDEVFIKNAFLSSISETVTVKIIRDRQSGYVLTCIFLFSALHLFPIRLRNLQHLGSASQSVDGSFPELPPSAQTLP